MQRRQLARASNGVVLYEGPSLYDGAPIAVILTCLVNPSRNEKTGAEGQCYVLRTDMSPGDARRSGSDGSVCNGCPLRPALLGGCYVNGMGLASVYKAYHAGRYENPFRFEGADRGRSWRRVMSSVMMSRWDLRFGTYANMSAAPFGVMESAVRLVVATERKWACYLSDWKTCDQRFRAFAMASVQSVEDAVLAHELGWRFYLSLLPEEAEMALGKLRALGISPSKCPYDRNDPRSPQCVDCGLCDGKKSRVDARSSIWCEAHGSAPVMKGFRTMRAALPVVSS